MADKNQQNPIHESPSSSSDHAFPMLTIAVLSIMASALVLFCYYIFVNKCSSNWHNSNLLRWISIWRARRTEDSFIALSPTMWNRGLDESIIRKIPTFQYRKREAGERSIYGSCVVCLNEFQDMDMVRVLPTCGHSFHLDCIDIWLQSNANCPLCRTSISGATKYPSDQIIAPSSSPQGSQPYTDSLMGGDEDFVVIELGGDNEEGVLLHHRQQERDSSRDHYQSPAKMEHKLGNKLKPRKRRHLSIMGDECIDVRKKDDQFSIQPIRRSFSLDSAVDQQLYLSVQAIIQQNTQQREINTKEESSNRVQRSFLLPFRSSSRKALLPSEFRL